MKFKPTITIVALLSVALNIGLLAHIISSSNNAELEVQTDTAQMGMPSNSLHQANYKKLLSKGLSDYQAKSLILDALGGAQPFSTAPDKANYWTPSVSNVRVERIQSRLDSQRKIRISLVEIFGETAKADSAFSKLFQPLAQRLPFLSSDQQIAVQEQRVSAEINTLKRSQSGNYDGEQARVNVTDLLPAEAAFEYGVRYSTKAEQLRHADIDFSEELFRDTFRVVAATSNELGKRQQGGSAIIQQRTELRALLGQDDATRVMAALDSRFANMSKKGRFQGLTQDQLYFVYQIIADSEAQMIRGYHLRQTNQNAGIKLIREASATRNTKLASYLGEEVAGLLMKAFTGNNANERLPVDVVQRY
jgi:hypothetical protein